MGSSILRQGGLQRAWNYPPAHDVWEVMKQKTMEQRPTRTREPWPKGAAAWEWDGLSPPPSPVPQRQGVNWEATVALFTVMLLIAGVATLFIVEFWLANRILPGVYAWDVNLGGLTRSEAIDRLAATFHYPADRQLTLRYGDQAWPVEPANLGMVLDTTATVDTALSVGHRGDLLERLDEQIDVLLNGTRVLPSFTFDAGAGTAYLSQVAGQVNRPTINATLSLGDDLSVSILSAQAGLEVDEEATRQALIQRFSGMAGGDVDLVVRQSEPYLTDADLQSVQSQVQRVLSSAVTLNAPGFEPWTIEPKTLAGWLILRLVPTSEGSTTLTVTLDAGQATRLAEEIASQVRRPPTDAQFRFDEGSGTLVPVVDSVAGQMLDVTGTVALIENAVAGDQRDLSLRLIPIRPTIASEDAAELGIVELIGEGKTTFAGSSASRVQNIVVGAAQFDGLLIAPGETFSFDEYLGEVTAEKGYEESIIIWGNTTKADVGGGLCQVSSTAFRAAFWAGVPIVERWPHAFRVSYYEPPKGLDATIYSPSVDLKWVNDTGKYILIQTYVDKANNTLTFRFYGTNPGRTVEIDGPYESNPVPHGPPVYREDPTLPKGQTKQIEWAKDGLDVTVYRVTKEDGVEVQRDTFFSRYQPWQAVYLVGTKEQ
jgi:vancomycin resistance protein YoaR